MKAMGFLSCPLCEHVTLTDLQELQQKIAKSLSRNLTCPICSSIIQGITSLHYHLAGHIPIKCPAIPLVNPSPNHTVNPSSPEQIPSLERLEIKDDNQQRIKSLNDECKLEDRSNEKTTKTGNTPNPLSQTADKATALHHNCDLCGLVFSTEYFLKLHKDIMHSNSNGFEVTCKLCESTFKDLEEYRSHVREVHSERRYICDRCPKSFKMKGGLLVHTRMYHDNSSPSTCQICQKHFTSKSLKELHEKKYHVSNKQPQNLEKSLGNSDPTCSIGDAKNCLETLIHQTSQGANSNQTLLKNDKTSTPQHKNSPKRTEFVNVVPEMKRGQDNFAQNDAFTSIPMSLEQLPNNIENQMTHNEFYQCPKETQIKTKQMNKNQRPKKQNSNKKSTQNQSEKCNKETLSNSLLFQLVAAGSYASKNPFINKNAPGIGSDHIENINQLTSFIQSPPSGSGFSYSDGSYFLPNNIPNGSTLESFSSTPNLSTPSKEEILINLTSSAESHLENYNQLPQSTLATPPQMTKSFDHSLNSNFNVKDPSPQVCCGEGPSESLNDYIISLPSNIDMGMQGSLIISPPKEIQSNSLNEVTQKDVLENNTNAPINKNAEEFRVNSPTKKDDSVAKMAENKQWECDTCKKSFTTKYFLKKHKRLHTGETPYSCEECGKTFVFQQSYHKHVFYHSDDKPHLCPHCGRAFKEMSTLHNHIRIHTGEKPFVCSTCGKAFRQRVSYFVHQRIHTGQMPYRCEACQRVFRYKVSLRSHKCSGKTTENNLPQNISEKSPVALSASSSTNEGIMMDNPQANAVSEPTQIFMPEGSTSRIQEQSSTNIDGHWFIPPTPTNVAQSSFGDPVTQCTSANTPQKSVALPDRKTYDQNGIGISAPQVSPQTHKEAQITYNQSSSFSNSLQLDVDLENENFLRSLFS